MGYTSWANSKVKKMDWLDVKLIKWSAAGFILLLAKVWPPLLSLDWYWYGLIGILAAARPVYRAYIKK